MIPNTTEGWILLIVACILGFGIGQWIRSRKKKGNAHEQAAESIRKGLAYAEKAAKKGKGKKKNRKKTSVQNP